MNMTYSEYEGLVKKLNKWAKAYYADGEPLATDEEYNRLARDIKQYELDNPEDKIENLSDNVGAVVTKGKKIKHIDKLWSLEDAFTYDEFYKWLSKFTGLSYYMEMKFDGLTLNILYEDGIIVSAGTRGDGLVGEDVTNNAMVIKGVPTKIPYKGKIEIRGEVVMPIDNFNRINEELASNGKPVLKNPRNAAAGTLSAKDPKVVKDRGLLFIPWDIGYTEKSFKTMSSKADFVSDLGFTKHLYTGKAKKYDDVLTYYEGVLSKRATLPYALDGVVLKVDDITKHDEIGYTNKFPKWALAMKFPALEKVTKLIDVTYEVGRYGTLSPVGILEPVILDGVTVNNVTLHNFNYIKTEGIMLNDIVTIIRSGDVIPKLINVFKDRRVNPVEITKPTVCPECKHKLDTSDINSRCINDACPGILKAKIVFFGSRKAMYIVGLGKKTASALVDSRLVNNIVELYDLSMDDLLKLDGFSVKKARNLLNSIASTIGSPMHKFIVSLGIENVGSTVSKKLVNKYGLNALTVDYGELLSIDGIGEEIANNIVNFASDEEEFLWVMTKTIEPTVPEKVKVIESVFNNKIMVLTGSFSNGKGEIQKELLQRGAIMKSSVSTNTDYVVYGEKAGSKYDKAIKLGVKTLNEEKYKEIISKEK